MSIGGLGALLLLASIVVELYGRPRAPQPPPTPSSLQQCERDVLELLENLAVTPTEMQRQAAQGQKADLGRDWERFSHEWDRRWDVVNVTCRFDELAETGLGPGFDRMAWVHRNLPRLKLQYREQMERFSQHQAETLAQMHEALARSRKLLQQPGAPAAP